MAKSKLYQKRTLSVTQAYNAFMQSECKRLYFSRKLKWHLAFFVHAIIFFMKSGLKSNWFMLRLLLIANAVLIGVIFFTLRNVKHEHRNIDCSETNVRRLSADALNAIAVKLMY